MGANSRKEYDKKFGEKQEAEYLFDLLAPLGLPDLRFLRAFSRDGSRETIL